MSDAPTHANHFKSMGSYACDVYIATAVNQAGWTIVRKGADEAGAGPHGMPCGAPSLSGAMAVVGWIRLSGAPNRALLFRNMSPSLLLARILAGAGIARDDPAAMGEGGLCLRCANCTFPECPFGK